MDVLIVLELIVTFEAGGMGTESSTSCRFMRVMQAKPAPPKSPPPKAGIQSGSVQILRFEDFEACKCRDYA